MIKYIKDFFIFSNKEKDFTFNTASKHTHSALVTNKYPTKTGITLNSLNPLEQSLAAKLKTTCVPTTNLKGTAHAKPPMASAKILNSLSALTVLLSLGVAGATTAFADDANVTDSSATNNTNQITLNNSQTPADATLASSSSDTNNKVLKVGYVNSSNYLIIDNYASIGLDYQLLSEFAANKGLSIQFQKYDSLKDLYKDLNDKKLDMAAGHLSVNSKYFNQNANLIPVDYLKEDLVLVSTTSGIKSLNATKGLILQNNKVFVPHNYELVNKSTLEQYFNLEDHGASSYKLLQEVNNNQIKFALVPSNVAKAMKQLLANIDFVDLDQVKFEPLATTKAEITLDPSVVQEEAYAKVNDDSESNNSASANLDDASTDHSKITTQKAPSVRQAMSQAANFALNKAVVKDTSAAKATSLKSATNNINTYYLAPDKAELATDLNNFIHQIKNTSDFESLTYSNLKNLDDIRPADSRAFAQSMQQKFEQYAPVFKKYSTDLDYRLAMAVGYQESKWNPSAKSPSGPSGLMMLTNSTAKSLNVHNKLDPVESISAGVKLLTSYWKQQPKQITGKDRMMYALAQYNQGIAKVLDARNWLKRKGLETDSYAVLAQNYKAIGQDNGHKYGKINGGAAAKYLHEVDRWYSMLINYRYFISK